MYQFQLNSKVTNFVVTLDLCSYGYRGRDARCNLYQLPTGEMVYFIASAVILYNVEEQMQRHYLGHTDDVKWYDMPLCQHVYDHVSI